MNRWYVLKTKPRKEDDVSTLLARANFEVFNPKIRDTFYRGATGGFCTKPLFPSYLFLHVNFDIAENIHMIKYTRGVSKILCAENKPVAVHDDLVETLKKRTNGTGIIEQIALKSGDSIRVRKGMLKDLEGILMKPSSDNERIIVLLKLVNYEMKAHLHWTEIEKLTT